MNLKAHSEAMLLSLQHWRKDHNLRLHGQREKDCYAKCGQVLTGEGVDKKLIEMNRHFLWTSTRNIIKMGVYVDSLSDHYMVYCIRKFNDIIEKDHKKIKTRIGT